MDFVFWIIVIVLVVGVVWWLLNRGNTAKTKGAGPERAEGGLARGSSAASAEAAATTGIPGAAGFGKAAEPAPPTTADDAPARSSEAARPESSAGRDDESGAALHATPASGASPRQGTTASETADRGEWETQWSEAAGSAPAAAHRPPAKASAQEHTSAGATGLHGEPLSKEEEAPRAGHVHHSEYTGPHSPTLPGAETAAAEAGDDVGQSPASKAPSEGAATDTATPTHSETPTGAQAPRELPADAPETETLDRARSSAAVETGASHTAEPSAASVREAATEASGREPVAEPAAQEPTAEPAGHLAADQPYGAGSASPAPDGSGPADFPVKGDAGAMVYYEEGHPGYEQTRAEVWFESAAHAEAAGFRAPRRKRL